ncbi:MAG: NTP transferase domain-containing protein [Candidatus Heteroscillospira sp.]|jgi:UDP-N-acetylglucosamine diphosphorylase/glucosamine-1-phosphate N-acetyltransferase
MNTQLKAVILAAGKGTRMQTEGVSLPKVMRQALGNPLLHYVLSALDFIQPEDCILVVGYKKEYVEEAFPRCRFALQAEQLGTGHAVQCAYEALGDFQGSILVCCGDMPLIRRETYAELCRAHESENNACTILSGDCDTYLPYGRILRDGDGNFAGMVEEKDATEEQKRITELNSGVYVFSAPALKAVLGQLRSDNAQGEYYLTDAPALMQKQGMKVGVCRRNLGMEIIGVNTPAQLREVEEILQSR